MSVSIGTAVVVVRRSLESWWRQPTFRRVYADPCHSDRERGCVGDRLAAAYTAIAQALLYPRPFPGGGLVSSWDPVLVASVEKSLSVFLIFKVFELFSILSTVYLHQKMRLQV